MTTHAGFSFKNYQIRFSDCDPFGHLNNARYFDYFMNAREDHLQENYNFSISSWMEESGFAWVVREHRIQYLRPIKVNEWVCISSAIIFQTEADNIVEFGIWDEARKKLKALLWSNYQYVNIQTMRPAKYQQEILDKSLPLVVESNLPEFDSRFLEMQNKFKA